MRQLFGVVTAVGALLALGVAPASAARPATAEELTAIAPAIGATPDTVAFAAWCLLATVTTEGAGEWAVVHMKRERYCPQADGAVIVERTADGVWHDRLEGSGWGEDVCGLTPLSTMSDAAGLDLGLCATSRSMRSPTPAEEAAIGRLFPSRPAGCVGAAIARPAPAVALVRAFSSADCPGDARELIATKRGGRWRVALELRANRPSCREPNIPERGMNALIGYRCGDPRAWWIPSGYPARLVREPRRFMVGAQFTFTQTRWRRWGASEVTGTGYLVHRYRGTHEQGWARIVLSGEQRCGSRTAYKTLTMRPLRPRDRRQLHWFAGDWTLHCRG